MTHLAGSVSLFRTQWAGRFVDEVDVVRFGVGGTFNRTTGVYDGATEPPVLSGGGSPNALIRPGSGEEDEELLRIEQQTFAGYDVYLAHDSPTFDVEDRVVVIASVSETELVGKSLRVVSIQLDSFNTRRSLITELDLGRGSVR